MARKNKRVEGPSKGKHVTSYPENQIKGAVKDIENGMSYREA